MFAFGIDRTDILRPMLETSYGDQLTNEMTDCHKISAELSQRLVQPHHMCIYFNKFTGPHNMELQPTFGQPPARRLLENFRKCVPLSWNDKIEVKCESSPEICRSISNKTIVARLEHIITEKHHHKYIYVQALKFAFTI